MFTISDLEGGILISLREVIQRLGVPVAAYWSLKDINFISRFPLEGDVFEFEKRSRSSHGVIMTQDEFIKFIDLDFQLADGMVEAADCKPDGDFLKITCVDSSYWEIETNAEGLLKILKQNHST